MKWEAFLKNYAVYLQTGVCTAIRSTGTCWTKPFAQAKPESINPLASSLFY